MEKIASPDGTLIAYERSGAGPPLVAVPGVLTASRLWPVLPALGQHFTVYAVDRRGHGDSGDTPSYALEREFEDVAAVVDAIGAEVTLLGHSFGGTCALGAALRTANIARLVIYEADAPGGMAAEALPAGLPGRFQALLDAGDRAGAVTLFLGEAFQMTPEELTAVQAWPTFPAMVAAAHTLPRELRALQTYQFDEQRFKELNVPALLLLGGASPAHARTAMEAWQALLPHGRLVVLPGQEHMAHYTAPDLFVRELAAFVNDYPAQG